MQQKFSNSINLYGFTILRNGVKFDYSFLESLESMRPIVQKIFLALDAGEDTTAEKIKDLDYVQVIPSTWDMSLKKGLVLSVETNKALNALREEHHLENDWGLYLQADEVIHEDDFEVLIKDLELAQQSGCDAISFCYLHFWQTHHHIAISKKWYPHEIRAVKLNTDIESWGDAQGFRNYKKVYESNARIFHYGHVREQESYQNKMHDMGLMYHDESALKAKLEKGLEDAKKNKCVEFFGNHPLVMKDRILRMNDIWEIPTVPVVYIIGNPNQFSSQVKSKINAKEINWVNSFNQVPKEYRNVTIKTQSNWLDKLIGFTKVEKKMKSKLARDWTHDFRLILQLSEKRIGLKAN